MGQKYLMIVMISCLSFISKAQDRNLDKLEMLYDQQHYKLVIRKAEKYLDNPEYDYSQLPLYYKSLAQYRLSMMSNWAKRHPNALVEAGQGLQEVLSGPDGEKYRGAKMYELQALKQDLYSWGTLLAQDIDDARSEEIKRQLQTIFEGIDHLEQERVVLKTEYVEFEGKRGELVSFARTLEGTPYKWSGNTPKGFDCSGFTSYVFKEFGKELPRRASEQFSGGTELNKKNVKPGDLVFFSHGKGISHVGIIVDVASEGMIMIHSSSSKGIILTNVDTSKYWSSRLVGYSSYF